MDLIKVREQLNLGIPLTNIKLRVTDYSRVSTSHEEQKSSLKNQVEYFNKYINNNPNWEYIEGYIDEGISGTTDYKRNNFMRMIEDAKSNKFDLIITKEISRFSRNTLDSIRYTRELLDYGVAVLFINDNINTALPDSELRLTIMSSLAQDEIRRLSERVKFGMHQSINNGKILGNNNLFGYRKNKDNKLIIEEKESIIIKDIFYKYVIDNYSLNKIAKLYNFSVTKVSRIIKNPKYKGYYCGRKSEVVDYISKKIKYIDSDKWIVYRDKKIPKIVDENIWDRANNKLKNNKKNITKNKYPLSGKIYCKKDNQLFYRRGKSSVNWYCSNYLINGKNKCNCKSIKENDLLIIIDKVFNYYGINIKDFYAIIKTNYEKNIYINNDLFRNKLIELLINKIYVSNISKNNFLINIILKDKVNDNYKEKIIINNKYYYIEVTELL